MKNIIKEHLFVSPLYSYNEGFVNNIKSKYNNFKNRYNNDENFRKKVKIGGAIIGGLGALYGANKFNNKFNNTKNYKTITTEREVDDSQVPDWAKEKIGVK